MIPKLLKLFEKRLFTDCNKTYGTKSHYSMSSQELSSKFYNKLQINHYYKTYHSSYN